MEIKIQAHLPPLPVKQLLDNSRREDGSDEHGFSPGLMVDDSKFGIFVPLSPPLFIFPSIVSITNPLVSVDQK